MLAPSLDRDQRRGNYRTGFVTIGFSRRTIRLPMRDALGNSWLKPTGVGRRRW